MDYIFLVDVDVAHSFRLGKPVAPRATIELYDHEWDIGRLPEEDRYVLGRGIDAFGVIDEGTRSSTSYVSFCGKFKVKETTIQGLIGAIREKLDDSPDARNLPEAVPVDEEGDELQQLPPVKMAKILLKKAEESLQCIQPERFWVDVREVCLAYLGLGQERQSDPTEPTKTVDCLECHGTGQAPNPQFSCAYCKDEDGVSTGKMRQLAERDLMPAIRTLEKVLANVKIDRSEIRNAIATLRRAF